MLQFKKIDEFISSTKDGMVITIYGTPDAGKSTFCATVSENLNVLYLDTEKRFGKIWDNVPNEHKNGENISSLDVKTLGELIQITSDKSMKQFNVVIIDSITKLVDNEMQNIAFAQRRKATFEDWRELGTNFIQACDNLKRNEVSMIFTIQCENRDGVWKPDTQGALIPKKVVEESDWLFFINKKDNGVRELFIKNNDSFCVNKSKGIPHDFPNIITGNAVNFNTFYDVFPAKPVPRIVASKETIARIHKEIKSLEKIYPQLNHSSLLASVSSVAKQFNELTELEAETMSKKIQSKITSLTINTK